MGSSFRVRAWTEMEMWCVKGMCGLKVVWSEKKFRVLTKKTVEFLILTASSCNFFFCISFKSWFLEIYLAMLEVIITWILVEILTLLPPIQYKYVEQIIIVIAASDLDKPLQHSTIWYTFLQNKVSSSEMLSDKCPNTVNLNSSVHTHTSNSIFKLFTSKSATAFSCCSFIPFSVHNHNRGEHSREYRIGDSHNTVQCSLINCTLLVILWTHHLQITRGKCPTLICILYYI